MLRQIGLMAIAALVCAEAPDAQSVYRVTGENGVSRPTLIKRVDPVATPLARSEGVQGWVRLEIVVLPTGRVGKATVIESQLWRYLGAAAKNDGPPRLLTAAEVDAVGIYKDAVSTVSQWVFEPGRRDGKPVAVQMVVELTYLAAAARRGN